MAKGSYIPVPGRDIPYFIRPDEFKGEAPEPYMYTQPEDAVDALRLRRVKKERGI